MNEPKTYGDLKRLVEQTPRGEWPSRVNRSLTRSQALDIFIAALNGHSDEQLIADTISDSRRAQVGYRQQDEGTDQPATQAQAPTQIGTEVRQALSALAETTARADNVLKAGSVKGAQPRAVPSTFAGWAGTALRFHGGNRAGWVVQRARKPLPSSSFILQSLGILLGVGRFRLAKFDQPWCVDWRLAYSSGGKWDGMTDEMLRELITQWRASAEWDIEQGSPEFGQGRDQCADELEALLLERPLPTIEEASGLLDDPTGGIGIGPYLDDLRGGAERPPPQEGCQHNWMIRSRKIHCVNCGAVGTIAPIPEPLGSPTP